MSNAAPRITAAIIAGGQAARLGGQDKALVNIGGRTQLQRLLGVLRPQSGRQVLVSNHPAACYAGCGIAVITDAWPGQPGPLAGIEAALRHAGGGEVLCVPADAAHVPPDLVARLYEARRREGCPAACVHDGAGLQPVCCLLEAALADSARRALEAGEFALHRWLKSCGLATADFAHWPRWAWSFNTPQELDEIRRHLNDT